MVAEVSASRSVAIRDVTLVVAVSLVYLGFEFLSIPKRWSFLFAGLALGAYVVYLAVDRRHSWHDLGFRRDNLTAGLLPVGVCTALVGAGLVAFAVVQRRAVWQPAVLVLLALYPLWALAQQFAFQGLLHGGLTVLVQSPSLQVLLTAAAFASVHVGNDLLGWHHVVAALPAVAKPLALGWLPLHSRGSRISAAPRRCATLKGLSAGRPHAVR